MAVPQRILNSTQPFFMSIDQPKPKVLGCFPSIQEPHLVINTGKDDKQHEPMFSTHISTCFQKYISHGTAKHVGTGPLGTEKPSIIAQAECESQDSQEFCPNSRFSRHQIITYSSIGATLTFAQGSVSRHQPRKKRRKRQRRRYGEEVQQRDGERLNRLPEQDSGELEECGYSSSLSRALSTESLSVQETTRSTYSSHPGLISTPRSSTPTRECQLIRSSSYAQESQCTLGSEDPDSSLISLALIGLRNNVTQNERSYASAFAKQMVKVWKDREEEEDSEEERDDSDINEGILFNEELQPKDYEYREGRDYKVCDLLKEGSYGVVYSIRDKSSGFTCAAKKVPLERFRSEEVGSWSALQSPHVVELFGFVREGPSVILFMDLKPGSLGQLLSERGRLPEDLSLHYLQQVLGALEYLHKKRILHLDIKADNVLLSEDGKDTFLCDFGQSERLDFNGYSPFQDLKGTETHMAPEVTCSNKRCAKADIWSSCCMLLHMLNGCQPWTRYYSRPLYLKIAEEPPPLREIPPNCNPRTADIIERGLQKEPSLRASAKDLRAQTVKALKELGGLHSPTRGGAYLKPFGIPERCEPAPFFHSSVRQWMDPRQGNKSGTGPKAAPKQCSSEVVVVDNEEEKEAEIEMVERNKGPSSAVHIQPSPLKLQQPTEEELRKLERDFYLSSLSQPHSAELQEQLLSCLSSDCLSTREPGDKKDSGRWSVSPGDDLSSGVFSYNSQSDGQSFSKDWLGSSPQPPPRCFEGVDVCIRDFNGRSLLIRETPRVKVGHIAKGISDQISKSVFSLQSEDGSLVPHDMHVHETGLFLRCVLAPDCDNALRHRHSLSCKTPWSWRIRDGVLETRD